MKLSTDLHCSRNEFSIIDFISKCDQIGSFLRIWSHLLKKSLMEIFISCAVSELCFSIFVGESRMALVSREIVSSVFKVLFQTFSK